MRDIFSRFFQSESTSGWLLLACISASLILANTPAGPKLASMLATEVGATPWGIGLKYPFLTWINDGLMAVFFLLVGLEVKRAFLVGELASFKKAALPVFAAVGGCIVPAALFGWINIGTDTARGWAIPMATDIAFALAVLRIAAGARAGSVKTFLSTLAIADDIAAILVIAVCYSSGIHTAYLVAAGCVFAVQLLFNKLGIKNLWLYVIPGLLLWYLVHHSGIHATIAGVLTAFAIPLRSKEGPSALERLEHALLQPVNFLIMPLFAFANTNIALTPDMLQGLSSPLSIGIAAGLLLGKPIGILLFSALTIKLRVGRLTDDMQWKHLLAVGLLAGIGFTMSIFIAMLSYPESSYQVQAKFAILLSSVLAGLIGFVYFRSILKPGTRRVTTPTRIQP